MEDTWKPVRRHCVNCGHILAGFRNGNGFVKLQCPRCGIVMVSRHMSRRHERIDISPPHGEIIEN